MKSIEKKLLPEYFEAVGRRAKTFELRKDDSDYQIGDLLTLREWNGEEYTGREIIREITYILRDAPEYGLMEGYCILSIQPVDRKQELVSLLREYRLGLAQEEYTAEEKDPIRLSLMDDLWRAENSLTGEEALRKYREETSS